MTWIIVYRENIQHRVSYLPLGPHSLENGFSSKEHQEFAVLLRQVKRLPQNLQHMNSGPHRQGVISTERPQPLQHVLRRNQFFPTRQNPGWNRDTINLCFPSNSQVGWMEVTLCYWVNLLFFRLHGKFSA